MIGEPPASKGYTHRFSPFSPSCWNGPGQASWRTITGFTPSWWRRRLTEPICDAVRSILDGHIVLSRTLAARNHYPAIDALNSVSRVMP
jgi:flagellar biosynthesis/type III secretory pathway ATPase